MTNRVGATRGMFSAFLWLALAGCGGPALLSSAPPASSPIQHVVVLVQETRSFNNLFAGFPGADTAMEGSCKAAPWCKGSHVVRLHSVRLESTAQPGLGVGLCDSHSCFETECDPTSAEICRMDGFDALRYGPGGNGLPARLYPYAYVERSETKPYWTFAHEYALSDEMFATDTAGSFISNLLLLSGTVHINNHESLTGSGGQPAGCDAQPGTHTLVIFKNRRVSPDGPFPCFTWRTIADLLDAKDVSWRYYIDHAFGKNSDFSGSVWNGFRAMKHIFSGPDWKKGISSPNTTIFSDLKTGALPSVSWVVPSLYDSDNPASGCNGGPWWVTKVVNAIGTSQYWKNSAIIVLWTDWGGWYDNAPPAQINYTSLGFRVPMIVISPYARASYISHTHYEFGSVLKFMEQTFNLGSLGTTDASAASMSDILDLKQRPLTFTPAKLPMAMSCKDKPTNPD